MYIYSVGKMRGPTLPQTPHPCTLQRPDAGDQTLQGGGGRSATAWGAAGGCPPCKIGRCLRLAPSRMMRACVRGCARPATPEQGASAFFSLQLGPWATAGPGRATSFQDPPPCGKPAVFRRGPAIIRPRARPPSSVSPRDARTKRPAFFSLQLGLGPPRARVAPPPSKPRHPAANRLLSAACSRLKPRATAAKPRWGCPLSGPEVRGQWARGQRPAGQWSAGQ